MAATTPNLKLATPPFATRGWDQIVNANFTAIDGQAPLNNFVVTPTETPSATLNVSVAAGYFANAGNALVAFAGQSGFALTANQTTYLWLTDAGVLTSGTAWPSGAAVVRLAIVTTAATTVATIQDARAVHASRGVAAVYAPAGSSYVVLVADPTLTSERVLTGTATGVTITDAGAGNAVTLNTAQPIAPTSSPTFATLTLTNAPSATTDAVRKSYADAADALRVLKAGDTMTGPLILAGQLTPGRTVTANATVLATDNVIRCDASGGAFTLTVPTGLGVVRFKKIDSSANAVTVASSWAMDGATTLTLTAQYQAKTLVGDSGSDTYGVY